MNNNDKNNNSNDYTPSDATTMREISGKILISLSNTINDNIIIARYSTIITVISLIGYSAYKSPIFFKFHSVSSIPKEYYHKRKLLVGRLVPSDCAASNPSSKAIRLSFQHYSILDRVLHRFKPKYIPSIIQSDLLTIELGTIHTIQHIT